MYQIQVKIQNEWDIVDAAASMKEARSVACNHATLQKMKTGQNHVCRIVGPGFTIYNPTCSDTKH